MTKKGTAKRCLHLSLVKWMTENVSMTGGRLARKPGNWKKEVKGTNK